MAPRSATGSWTGSVIASNSLYQFGVDLVDAGGTITGTAHVLGAGDSCVDAAFSVAGSRSGSAVTLEFTCPSYTPFSFDATLSRDARTLQGTLRGSGFDGNFFNLSKTD
jgi:hypothetical protein